MFKERKDYIISTMSKRGYDLSYDKSIGESILLHFNRVTCYDFEISLIATVFANNYNSTSTHLTFMYCIPNSSNRIESPILTSITNEDMFFNAEKSIREHATILRDYYEGVINTLEGSLQK